MWDKEPSEQERKRRRNSLALISGLIVTWSLSGFAFWQWQQAEKGHLLHTFQGHTDTVLRVVFSPDGKTIATGNSDNTVKLWNLSGQLLHTLQGHSSFVTSVVFSPDGNTLLNYGKL
ncbi:WD40 repeat domain-containing protein [Nostoc sp.]|uniref:WD40 repeat domain-containing protein n=1 Tax=Nostoc sp. TaxID=1180 RepID=UPI002FF4611A